MTAIPKQTNLEVKGLQHLTPLSKGADNLGLIVMVREITNTCLKHIKRSLILQTFSVHPPHLAQERKKNEIGGLNMVGGLKRIPLLGVEL